jgi:hypothetical protein
MHHSHRTTVGQPGWMACKLLHPDIVCAARGFYNKLDQEIFRCHSAVKCLASLTSDEYLAAISLNNCQLVVTQLLACNNRPLQSASNSH